MAVVISASRRTDIPSFYADWFFERLMEGFVDVRNPFNPKQMRRVLLDPESVGCLVFWTRDARPMLSRLDELEPYAFYFHITIIGYGAPLEPSGPLASEAVEMLKTLASEIGQNRVIWRYDPILLAGRYDANWHIRNFAALAKELSGSVRHCVISIYDAYRHTDVRLKKAGFLPLCSARGEEGASEKSSAHYQSLAKKLTEIAASEGIFVSFCAEPELQQVQPSLGLGCIDSAIISELTHQSFSSRKDKNQRPACKCIESVDIGSYGTCPRGCLYCYANRAIKKQTRNSSG